MSLSSCCFLQPLLSRVASTSHQAVVPVRWRNSAKMRKFLKNDAKLDWAAPLIQRQLAAKEGANEGEKKEEPYQLHVVSRIKTLVGRPWWEKDIMKKLELDGTMYRPVLTKNTPEMNKLLREVKHLVHIQPLRMPHGLPTHESDYEHTMITSDGRMLVKRRLAEHEPDPEKQDDREKWRMTPETVKNRLDYLRVNHQVHKEYHRTKYEYKRNQDGKEYRYNFNKY